MKVLVVDDERFIKEDIIEALKSDGFEVVGASNGREALKLLVAQKFDVVISDYSMPGLNGLELLTWVILGDLGDFILMTGILHNKEKEVCGVHGAKVIEKPFMFKDLRLLVGASSRSVG